MLRFGIIGFGLHARKRLAPALSQSASARLVALSRRDLATARAVADELQVPLAFGSVEDLCTSPEVDAVFVASPNLFHAEHTLAAVRAGKHVLCEKPMAMNAGEAREMVDAARHYGRTFGVAQVFRFTRSIAAMRDAVAGGKVGKPRMAYARFSFPGQTHARQWIHDAALGAGVIGDVGVHCLDALRWILRDEIAEVQALATHDSAAGTAETDGMLNLRFRSGALACVAVSMRAPYRTYIEVTGDSGTIIGESALAIDAPATITTTPTAGNPVSHSYDNRDAFLRMIDAFAAAVSGGPAFPATAEEGWCDQFVLDAAYASLQNRTLVDVQLCR